MNANEQLISDFYTSFQKLDAAGMNACYSGDVVFFDPVFEVLQAPAAKAMWRMLCSKARDFNLTFGNIKDLEDGYYTCEWVASYTFSKTGRKVENNVKAHMQLADGKIIEHSDGFSLHTWSKQALGFGGWLLGWNSFYQRKIKSTAKRNLLHFMESEHEKQM